MGSSSCTIADAQIEHFKAYNGTCANGWIVKTSQTTIYDELGLGGLGSRDNCYDSQEYHCECKIFYYPGGGCDCTKSWFNLAFQGFQALYWIQNGMSVRYLSTLFPRCFFSAVPFSRVPACESPTSDRFRIFLGNRVLRANAAGPSGPSGGSADARRKAYHNQLREGMVALWEAAPRVALQ